jgi:hypothetical protein
MSGRRALGVAIAALAGTLLLATGARAQSAALSVSVDQTEISTALGESFGFQTTIANPTESATPRLIAHLNILDLTGEVYVDPEDWSSRRTQYLGTIPAGGSRTITWGVTGVNGGSLAAYVAVLPQDNPSSAPATSPAIRITVAERKTLNSGGILPLALGVPGFVGVMAVGVRLARRRR